MLNWKEGCAMKKVSCILAVLALLFLAGCGQGSGQSSERPPDGESGGAASSATPVALETLLSDIQGAVPGTAGSTLKQLRAAGELLDWAQDGGAAQTDALEMWLAGSLLTPGAMAWSYAGVLDAADRILSGESGIAAELDDAGYVLQHTEYDQTLYRGAARSLSLLFTRVLEACDTTPYDDEVPGDYKTITLERLQGVWCDGELKEMLVFSGDTCRVVIPYLDLFGETAYAARVRDRSKQGYCPALEVDFRESGCFDAPLIYYVSGLNETHFWCITQSQKMQRIPTD